jgi:dTDP-4-dehydrorhamnose 3,5-epimerase
MIATKTPVEGVFVLDIERREDDRGFFARTFDEDALRALGLEARVLQASVAFNPKRGTLRGMHLQCAPHGETKIVRCTRGAIHDVALDLRPESPTFKRWFATELDEDNRRALYIPKGCAHGVLTLRDDTEVLYLIADPYVAEAATGVRWDDPAFGILWPIAPIVISERDRTYPFFKA